MSLRVGIVALVGLALAGCNDDPLPASGNDGGLVDVAVPVVDLTIDAAQDASDQDDFAAADAPIDTAPPVEAAIDLAGADGPDLSPIFCDGQDSNCPHGMICNQKLGFVCTPGCDGDWACPGGNAYACCSEVCTDIEKDPQHCGSCGSPCSSNNGTPSCVNGFCAIACNPGWADCDGEVINGCETDLNTSNASCGSCGHACAAGTQCNAASCS